MRKAESPVFVKARQIEDAAFAFHRVLIRAGREPRPALADADLLLAALRTYLRLACELKFLSVKQYEHAARLADELGRLVGGWMRAAAGGSVATTADRGRGVGAGSRPAGRVLEHEPDQPPGGEPEQRHAGQPEHQHRRAVRE